MTDVWVDRLLAAEAARAPMTPLTATDPDLDLGRAYRIQDALVARRVAAGERVVGAKLGLTSRAKQEAMGVHEPLYAWLTDAMLLPDDHLALDPLIHPRAEPEIAFVLGTDLTGPGVTPDAVLAATATVCAALEVIDSRYADFRFTLPDVVADNASAARVRLGATRVGPPWDLAREECALEVDGTVVATATGAAVLGDPAEAVALLANDLARRGRRLEAGWVVLSGALTAAVPLRPGQTVRATFARLGTVALHAEGSDA